MIRFVRVAGLVAWLGFVTSATAAPVVYNVTSLFTDPSGELDLMGGKKLQIKTPLSRGFQVHFEDTMPGANWGHPALFKVIAPDGTVVESVKVRLPPDQLSAAPVLGPSRESNAASLKFAINDHGGKLKVKDASKHYALLINGRADQRHWNDFSFLYRVLIGVYGYKKENILVADGAFKGRSPDLDGDGEEDIQYGSTLDDLKTVMGKLKDTLKADDQLLIAVNDHGSQLENESTIVLYDGEIKASEFGKLLNAIPAGRVLSIYEQCFSGGFVRPSAGARKVSMAAATDNEYSWASMDLLFDEFIYHVIVAFAMQTHEGKAVTSDLNKDGRVSAQEAFAYAVANDQRRESPMLETGPNGGASATLGIGF